MGVISLNTFRTETGRLADHMAATTEALALLHRLGQQAMVIQPLEGNDVGTISTVVNYASNAARVAGIQAIMADEGWQEFWLRAAAGGSATPTEASLFQDLDPSFQPTADRPMGALLAIQWRPKPGRMVDFVGQVMTAVPHIERMGGTVRTTQSLLGAYPMTVLISTSFADLDAYGAYADMTATDAQWQEFWGGAMADPTANIVRSGLYLNISG